MNISGKIVSYLRGAGKMFGNVHYFSSKRILAGKKVAVIGAAATALSVERGPFIDRHDFVIRLNRALVSWKPENERFIGTKSNILLHNFHENNDTGGAGKLDLALFARRGVQYLVQARVDASGIRTVLNFYRKYRQAYPVYLTSPRRYAEIKSWFGRHYPTRGFCALALVLQVPCKQVFITGFTFFKTPYQAGYREEQPDVSAALRHIKQQDMHNPEIELQRFLELVRASSVEIILLDEFLYELVLHEAPDLVQKVKQAQPNPLV